MKKALKLPNWQHWNEMGVITITEAIFLSLNKEPETYVNRLDSDGRGGLKAILPQGGEEERRLMVIMTALNQSEKKEGSLVRAKHCRQDVDFRMPQVELIDFGNWAAEKGWDIPKEFPTDNLRIKRTSDGEVKLTFPYEVPILAAIKEVMVEYKEKKAINKPLQQKNVPKLLVKAMAKQNKILSMDAARRIATLIQPLDARKVIAKKSPQ